MKIKKLYTAKTFIKNFATIENVTIHWNYFDVQWENANYGDIIEGYNNMESEDKKRVEAVVNDYFTIDEIEFLRNYFNDLDVDLVVEEVPLPINIDISHIDEEGFSILLPQDYLGHEFISSFTMGGDNNLPFKIWGDVSIYIGFTCMRLRKKYRSNK